MDAFPFPPESSPPPDDDSDSLIDEKPPGRSWFGPVHWWFWLGMTILIPGAASLWAVSTLLELSAPINCWAVSQGSASARIYCAEMRASKQTPEDLRRAITLVDGIAESDPLREKGDRLVETWTNEMLRLGEMAFQEGNLDKAIEIAEKIPRTESNYQGVSDRIEQWRSIWEEAETIYNDTLAEIESKNWYGTLTTARQLLLLDNQYWETTKYQELMTQLAAARQQERLDNRTANNNSRSSSTDWLTRWEQEQAALDANQLQKAKELANFRDVEELRMAIDEAEQILFGTRHYEEAQQLIDTWNQQLDVLEDQPRLDRAIELANQGDTDSLRAAIDEAEQIPWDSTFYNEARDQIEAWRDQMYERQVQAQMEELEQMTSGSSSLPITPIAPDPLPAADGSDPSPDLTPSPETYEIPPVSPSPAN